MGQIHPRLSMVTASAPGKVILFGEHAVVYGEPAVAVAIDGRVTVTVEPCSGGWKVEGYNLESGRHPHLVNLRNAILGEDFAPHNITVRSTLFSAAGLGSSAALSSAAAAAFIEIANEKQNLERIASLAHLAEASAQSGRASPTDTSTSTLGECVLVSDRREEYADWRYSRELSTPEGDRSWQVHSVTLPEGANDLWLVVGYTGIHAPTGEMVAGVAELLERNPSKREDIVRMGEVARAGVVALQQGQFELVGQLMNEAHRLLSGVGVSCSELDEMVEVARRTSLGAKLTGSGGGGCMLALTERPEETSQELEMRGAKVLLSPLGARGVEINR